MAIFAFICLLVAIFDVTVRAEPFTPCNHRSCLSCQLISPILNIDDTGLAKLAQDQYELFKDQGAKLYDFIQCVFCIIPVGFKSKDMSCGLRLNVLRECKPGLKCKNRKCINPKLNKRYPHLPLVQTAIESPKVIQIRDIRG